MDKVIKVLRAVLAAEFPGASVTLTHARPSPRVGGQVVWDGFEGMSQLDRQRRLRRAVDAGMPAEDRLAVSLILTLTPEETVVMSGSSDD